MVTGMAIGKTVGGPRAEKEEGWSEVGVRDLTAEGGGRRRKYFSVSVGRKGCH